MEVARLQADAENLTEAMCLHERMGFQVRKTNAASQKLTRKGIRGLSGDDQG